MVKPKGAGGAAKAQLATTALQKAKLALEHPATQAQLAKARAALEDPAVRAKLVEGGRTAANRAKAWKETRDAERPVGDDRAPSKVARAVTAQFGQGRAEKRIAALRSSIETLGAGRPELAAALGLVEAAILETEDALRIAAALPVAKRPRAYARIDDKLDELEYSLFERALPGGSTDTSEEGDP